MTANGRRLDKAAARLTPTRPPDVHVVSLDPDELAEFIANHPDADLVVNLPGVDLARMT